MSAAAVSTAARWWPPSARSRIDLAAVVPSQRAVDHRVAGQQARAVQHHVGTLMFPFNVNVRRSGDSFPRGEGAVHLIAGAKNQCCAGFRQKCAGAFAAVVEVDGAGLDIQRAAIVNVG